MDIRVIINGLIIIFILHIILLNINYSVNIGNKKNYENFESNIDINAQIGSNDKTMKFLTETQDNNNDNDEFQKKLMKYIEEPQTVKENNFEQKNVNKVMPSNNFIGNDNVPNFESNVADVSKFYNINYDNLTETKLKEVSTVENPKINQETPIKHEGRESTQLPDTWEYKNELPMNGGSMNGVFGFDSLESQFAIYNGNKLNLQSANDNNFNNIPHDDLRKPIIYEN